jgi:hypothetical protein
MGLPLDAVKSMALLKSAGSAAGKGKATSTHRDEVELATAANVVEECVDLMSSTVSYFVLNLITSRKPWSA